jgi:hypothetical protein
MIIFNGESRGIELTLVKQVSKFDKVIETYKNNKPKIKIKNVNLVQCDILSNSNFVNGSVIKIDG